MSDLGLAGVSVRPIRAVERARFDAVLDEHHWLGRRLVGDPMCPLRWTSKSTGNLADALTAAGHPVSADTVGRLLEQADYSLQATRKTREGKDHPDRDAQFGYLAEQVAEHLAAGEPVVSVDAKKKEMVGNKSNRGREWLCTWRTLAIVS